MSVERGEREPSRERVPVEIEIKVVELEPLPEFEKKLNELNATLVTKRRLIHDEAYKLPKNSREGVAQSMAVPAAGFADKTQLRHAIELLGLQIVGENDDLIQVDRLVEELPQRTARIRRDGEKLYWTVKEKRKSDGATVDHRQEANVPISEPKAVVDFLATLGYQLNSVREKFRTSYDLDGALVEVNEGPLAPPWLEIEAKDEATVIATLSRLGYDSQHTARISDTQYYRLHGVPDDKIDHLVFESGQG